MNIERLIELINSRGVVWYDNSIKIELNKKEWFIDWNSNSPMLCQKVNLEVFDFVNKYNIHKLSETKTVL